MPSALMSLPLLSPVTRPVLMRVVTRVLAADLASGLRPVRPGLAATQASLSGHSEASTRRGRTEDTHGAASVVLVRSANIIFSY